MAARFWTHIIMCCVSDHGVLLIEQDPPLNMLAIFIVLGIGADDVFITVGASFSVFLPE